MRKRFIYLLILSLFLLLGLTSCGYYNDQYNCIYTAESLTDDVSVKTSSLDVYIDDKYFEQTFLATRTNSTVDYALIDIMNYDNRYSDSTTHFDFDSIKGGNLYLKNSQNELYAYYRRISRTDYYINTITFESTSNMPNKIIFPLDTDMYFDKTENVDILINGDLVYITNNETRMPTIRVYTLYKPLDISNIIYEDINTYNPQISYTNAINDCYAWINNNTNYAEVFSGSKSIIEKYSEKVVLKVDFNDSDTKTFSLTQRLNYDETRNTTSNKIRRFKLDTISYSDLDLESISFYTTLNYSFPRFQKTNYGFMAKASSAIRTDLSFGSEAIYRYSISLFNYFIFNTYIVLLIVMLIFAPIYLLCNKQHLRKDFFTISRIVVACLAYLTTSLFLIFDGYYSLIPLLFEILYLVIIIIEKFKTKTRNGLWLFFVIYYILGIAIILFCYFINMLESGLAFVSTFTWLLLMIVMYFINITELTNKNYK